MADTNSVSDNFPVSDHKNIHLFNVCFIPKTLRPCVAATCKKYLSLYRCALEIITLFCHLLLFMNKAPWRLI